MSIGLSLAQRRDDSTDVGLALGPTYIAVWNYLVLVHFINMLINVLWNGTEKTDIIITIGWRRTKLGHHRTCRHHADNNVKIILP